MERRLTTILAADVVGYSRLMEVDEAETLAALKAHREELIDPLISEHRGRVVKLMGDGALVEFGSVVDAVTCALAIQEGMVDRGADVPAGRRIVFRIGIHLGDVMVEGDDLYGDGVNVAARLEGLAEPGGICISQQVLDHVETKLELACDDMGDRHVKNIARPIHAYGVRRQDGTRPAPSRARRKIGALRLAASAAVLLLVAAGGIAAWQLRGAVEAPRSPAPAPAAALTEKPSIAVLPFANISDDPEQEYFAEGMAEDLITDLSKLSGLTVISSATTVGYRNKKVDVRDVGKVLGVRYVVEGSVRKAGNRVRINAQLVDTATGGHLWGDRYDGDLNDIFSLQDKVLEQIVSSLAITLSENERRRLAAKGTDSIAAHDLYLQGVFQESGFTRQGNERAMRLYEQALSIDPDYALPYARMANILELNSRNGWSDDVKGDLEKAVKLAEKAIRLDPQNPYLYWSFGRSVARLRTPEALARGIKALERAIELDPDFADAYAFLAVLYVADGRADDGLRSVQTAMRLNPHYPFWYLFMRGMTRYVVKDYDAAIADFETAAERSPTALFVKWWLAAAYAQAGRIDDAQWEVDEMKLMGFKGTIETIVETGHIQDPTYLALYKEGLRKAGIPE